MRIGEAIALRWGDVGFNRRRVQVRRRYFRGTLDTPKSRYGRHDVPISQRLAHELELRWMVLDQSNLMRRVLKPAARRAGVPWAGFHTFRHTCATMLSAEA